MFHLRILSLLLLCLAVGCDAATQAVGISPPQGRLTPAQQIPPQQPTAAAAVASQTPAASAAPASTKTPSKPATTGDSRPAKEPRATSGSPVFGKQHVNCEPLGSADGNKKSTQSIRNVILFIGDGMGPQQLGLLLSYAKLAPNSTVPERTTAIELLLQQGQLGLVRTEPYGALVTDSAAAATQLATGQPTRPEMIGLNYRGETAETVLEIAQAAGKATGLITDTRLTHATPAAFAAHQPHRNMENEIAVDLLDHRVDVLLGGGLRHWLPQAVNHKQSAAYLAALQMNKGQFDISSKRTDNRNLLLEVRQDYQLVFDHQALAQVTAGRVLGLFADSGMQDALSVKRSLHTPDRSQPTLAEMTSQALKILAENPQGFFLMVEAGQIDWAGHSNDTGTMLHEMLRFDAALRCVWQWAQQRTDTLILVTADHETGGFGFSYSGANLPAARGLPGTAFAERTYRPNFNFAQPSVLDRLYAQEKSFAQLFQEFDALPATEQTPEGLVALVNDAMPFQITLADGLAILARQRNPLHKPGHAYLSNRTVPRIEDFGAFYVFGENSRHNLLGRALATQQNCVWSTGSHTSTPVPIIATGPAEVTRNFTGFLPATEVGQRMIQIVRGRAEQGGAARPPAM